MGRGPDFVVPGTAWVAEWAIRFMAPARPAALASPVYRTSSQEGVAVIRIALGIMPPLLRSIVGSALESQEDFAVMPASQIAATNGTADVDVVMVCADRDPPDSVPVSLVLGSKPPAIVAIESAGTGAAIIRVTTEHRAIGAASDLCDAVRSAALRRRAELH